VISMETDGRTLDICIIQWVGMKGEEDLQIAIQIAETEINGYHILQGFGSALFFHREYHHLLWRFSRWMSSCVHATAFMSNLYKINCLMSQRFTIYYPIDTYCCDRVYAMC